MDMECFIYRSERKSGTYLFLPEQDDFSQIPDSLIKLLGELTYSFSFDLHQGKPLAIADATQVIKHIESNGYFLQLPPGKDKTETKLN